MYSDNFSIYIIYGIGLIELIYVFKHNHARIVLIDSTTHVTILGVLIPLQIYTSRGGKYFNKPLPLAE